MRLAVPTPTNEYGWGQLVGHDRSFPVLVDRGHGNTYDYDGFKNGFASYVFRMPSGKVCRVQRSGSEWITNGMDGSVYVGLFTVQCERLSCPHSVMKFSMFTYNMSIIVFCGDCPYQVDNNDSNRS